MTPLLTPFLVLPGLLAQDLDGLTVDNSAAMSAWQAQHGSAWQQVRDDQTGYTELLFGSNAAAPFVPEGEQDWYLLAELWAGEAVELMGLQPWHLTADSQQFLALGMVGTTDKVTVQLQQEIGGVPVEGGFLNALFDTRGRLLSLANTTVPGLGDPSAKPALTAEQAQARARRFFMAESRLEPTFISEPELLFARLEEGGPTTAALAWKVIVHHKQADGSEPVGAIYCVDAATGGFLRRDEAIHHAVDVTGRIDALATGGSGSNDTVPSETPIPVGYLTLTSSAGNVVTNANGEFTIVGVNTPVNITATFNGPYCDTNNDQGADYGVSWTNVQPNTANVLVMNATPSEFVTAQANVQIHHGVVRDFIITNAPGDTTADFQAVGNANLPSTCNAYFDGVSTNYYAAGGGCSNTAFSNVVAHELGHWLNVRYNTGNGGDGMGEGNADVFAMYTYDTPVIGEGFFAGTGQIRNGTNLRQYCGDGNGGCYGAVHTDGEVWMGAAWKVRTNLKNSLGAGLGGQTANMLFLGWMNSYNQTAIDSIIEIQWLTLDDDDGSIGNGTPNYSAIDAGFRTQGFPGYDLPFIQISNVTNLPDVPDNVGPYTVTADVVAGINPPLASATLHYKIGNQAFLTAPMSNVGGDTYEAQIPNFQGAAVVSYYISGTDNLGQSGTYPDGGAASALSFSVGTLVVVASADFESNQGWTVGTPNNATTGNWVRGDPIGTAAQPEDDHTPSGAQCWFTGQGSIGGSLGENDVDGGTTTLVSPAFDLSSGTGHQVSYWRWYSNNTGASPNADTFVVSISGNGGVSWVDADIVGPSGAGTSGGWVEHSFTVSDYITPTNNVVIRVQASDLGSGSIVEAAFDDFELSYLEDPTNCAAPTTYCTSLVNSTGGAAFMTPSGTASIAQNDLVLTASNVPAGQFGLFYYGDQTANVPTGAGIRCVGGQLYRLSVGQIDPLGSFSQQVDQGNLAPGSTINPGETWYFSFWFRDPGFGGSSFNFADGVQVTFCP